MPAAPAVRIASLGESSGSLASLQRAYVTFGLGPSIGAYGGLDKIHRDPQAVRDVGGERAGGTDRGRV